MLRRVWVLWATLACGVVVGCSDGGAGTGGGTSSSSSSGGGGGGAPPACGDGNVDTGEDCDDGNTASGDGCDDKCKPEKGFTCTGSPSDCKTTCGDGIVGGVETCDDGNTAKGDGCSDTCATESGFKCDGEPSACVTTCGDGIIAGAEKCDDGNATAGDGCDDKCAVEMGWDCGTDAPSVCAEICGDGQIVGAEKCDDSNTTTGDGCDDKCAIENGWACTGAPSMCTSNCGDGIIAGAETCDDGNTTDKDGCSAACATEDGWTCTGAPSTCVTTCGDGVVAGTETCDDGNTTSGDGCDATCAPEPGWTCTGGGPGSCVTTCGDGIVAGAEKCDDGNATGGDGCDATCSVESGYVCTGSPKSTCNTVCGDSIIAGAEKCDDGNSADADGCSATCQIEAGYQCTGLPSACNTVCGDGFVVAGKEGCDDMNTASGDGCSATCAVEAGFTCTGAPSACVTTCGDGIIAGAEACDDQNATDGDGCSSACTVEAGYGCSGQPSVCGPVCGDGVKVGGEKCDDGNIISGDCCSSSCQIEPGCEIEVNDTINQANDFSVLAQANKVKGFIRPAGDVDVYSVVVPPGNLGAITVATLDGPAGSQCAPTPVQMDTTVTVYNAQGTSVGSDTDAGPGLCSLLTVVGQPPGTYFIEVKRGSSGPTTFDYTLQINVQLVVCGNGIVELGEQCDDGNTNPGDGCNANCKLEPNPETEPNGACGVATSNFIGTIPPNKLVTGSNNPQNDSDWFRFTLTNYADVRVETFDSSGPPNCVSIDTKIQAFNSACVALGGLDDDSGPNFCSLLDPTVSTQAFMRHLAPGDYYINVFPYSSTTAVFNYQLLITTVALCGNGVVEGSEQCDGTPNCQPDCNLVPVCGDGVRSGSEQCDDGNTVAGDGCGPTCQVEATTEVEPNDTTAQADAALPAVTANTKFFGALSSSTDKDLYKITMAAAGVIHAETFDVSLTDCNLASHTLTLLSSTGTTLNTDTGTGINSCSALAVNVLPGTYYIQVSASAALPQYVLDITFPTSNGTETEPNDTQATANTEAGNRFYVCGDHQNGADLDVFAITVPAGKSIRAEVVEVLTNATGYETCEGLGVDSLLTLYSPAFVSLTSDDDSGRGFCSLIDGTGNAPAKAPAHNLSAGTYYLEVKKSSLASATGAVFNYCLEVIVR